MVLSNKKLKQRIRQDLVKSLSVSVAETNPQSQSLKFLLDSSSHKPRLSKREKKMGLFLKSYMLGVFLIRVQKMRFVATSEAVESSLKLTARCVLRMVLSVVLPSSLLK
ncbi:unnamed protein product [Arabidopsis arenosa]|uniref:Uncharacterized protein n=1 Tax=Arabidopsis arenosa TaxID=38785 RepID=A0A8S1ZZG0_ARAAE|nr:unnamed protein product [Arabidopsis arenosa]